MWKDIEEDMLAMGRERKCLSCKEPCRNVRHPDTLDYDPSLPECYCCIQHPDASYKPFEGQGLA